MNLEEYKKKYTLYEDFAAIVVKIIEVAISNDDNLTAAWNIQSRAKKPASLEKKLKDRDKLKTDTIEQDIKDLAGCRLILYSNDDVNFLKNSRILYDNFEIDPNDTKIHYPSDDEEDVDKLYCAHHYIVSFKEDRLALPEYHRFEGLRCEIQIQTILNHAWSETGHDIVYKPIQNDAIGDRKHKQIRKRMAKIMKDYLRPAGYEFSKVMHDYDRLSKGLELFDSGVLITLKDAENNSVRLEILERYQNYILPDYNDIQAVSDEIYLTLKEAIKGAIETRNRPIETQFGISSEYIFEVLLDKILSCFQYIQFFRVEKVFDKYCEIYQSVEAEKEKKLVLDALENMAKHNLFVWEKIGVEIQYLLIKHLQIKSNEELITLNTIVIKVCRQVLSSEVEGTSSSFDQMTFHRGSVLASKHLKEMRIAALDILMLIFQSKNRLVCDGKRKEIIYCFNEAMRLPRYEFSDELQVIIVDDSLKILDFYLEHISKISFPLRETIEHDIYWMFYRQPAKNLLSKILDVRDVINKNEDFVRYKVLVGFEGIFPPAWEEKDSIDKIKEKEKYRDTQIAEYIEEINASNFEQWYSFIIICSKTKSDDLATFPKFGDFLRGLCESKPDLFLGKLKTLDENIIPFLPAILGGMLKSTQNDKMLKIVDGWIETETHLEKIALFLGSEKDKDIVRMGRVVSKAVTQNTESNLYAVYEIIKGCLRLEDETLFEQAKVGFLKGIRYFIEVKETRWVNNLWEMRRTHFLDNFKEGEIGLILNSLLPANIGHRYDELLQIVAKNNSKVVMDHFSQRFELNAQLYVDNSDLSHTYEAVPYQFQGLEKVLSKYPKLIIEYAKKWYEQEETLFQYRGGRFVSNIFTTITDDFKDELIALIKAKSSEDIDVVIAILRNYKGQTMLHPICHELILKVADEDEELRKEKHLKIQIILSSTGVVTGEFGFVGVYKQKQKEIRYWLDDENKNIQDFAKSYIDGLDKEIAAEQRRCEQQRAQRKRDFDRDEDEGKGK